MKHGGLKIIWKKLWLERSIGQPRLRYIDKILKVTNKRKADSTPTTIGTGKDLVQKITL